MNCSNNHSLHRGGMQGGLKMVSEMIVQWMIDNVTAETLLIIFAFVVSFYPLFWMIYRYGIMDEKKNEKKSKMPVAKTVSKRYEDVDMGRIHRNTR